MGYSLYNEREENPISIDEWKMAVSEIASARIRLVGPVAINPDTGERIDLAASEGDMEVLLSANDLKKLFGSKPVWGHAISFFWRQGGFQCQQRH
jgi:hypothetical protein